MACLGRLPHLLQQARRAFKPQPLDRDIGLILALENELHTLRHTCSSVLLPYQDRWRNIDTTILNNPSLTQSQKRVLHCNTSRFLAFGLMVGIVINVALIPLQSALNKQYSASLNTLKPYHNDVHSPQVPLPSQIDPTIQTETAEMSHQILTLAPIIGAYRPLGSAMMALSLTAAWIGVADQLTKDKIRAAISDFHRDVYADGGGVSEEDLERCVRYFEME